MNADENKSVYIQCDDDDGMRRCGWEKDTMNWKWTWTWCELIREI